MTIMLKDASLYDLLPPNAQGDDNIVAAVRSLDNQMLELYERIETIAFYRRLYNGQVTHEEADERAWQYKLAYYDDSLTIEQKIGLLKSAVETNKSKGTPAAVEGLITILFGDGYVQEWFEYGGAPGYYQVITNNPDVTEERAQEFVRAINSVTRLSAWLERVTLSKTDQVNLYIGVAQHSGKRQVTRGS
ncbi:phage tail protein [Paenibacillus pabuli]|uniref:phage tail protein n=1 Tax=Paenibacillus pabuli TaxID=1472 RepID=UPI001FFEC9EF|nr:phage tail protein [Paenibacillus pabuli]UPK45903.1 phage tail protein [Paenibacillus pabuli]